MVEWLLLMGADVVLNATAEGGVIRDGLRCSKDTCHGTMRLWVI